MSIIPLPSPNTENKRKLISVAATEEEEKTGKTLQQQEEQH